MRLAVGGLDSGALVGEQGEAHQVQRILMLSCVSWQPARRYCAWEKVGQLLPADLVQSKAQHSVPAAMVCAAQPCHFSCTLVADVPQKQHAPPCLVASPDCPAIASVAEPSADPLATQHTHPSSSPKVASSPSLLP